MTTTGESDRVLDVDQIKPINKFVLVRKCRRGDEGLIITPEQYKDECQFVEVLKIGNKCELFDESCIGKFVTCPESSHGMHCIDDKGEFWMVKEDVLDKIVIG